MGVSRFALGLAALVAASAVSGAPSQQQPLEARVQRLEQLADNQMLVEMLNSIERMQQEIQLLRGQVEEQGYIIEGLKKRQGELYRDIDRRLSRVEREGAAGEQNKSTALDADAGTAVINEEEQKAYQNAFEQLRNLRYQQAGASFHGFLKTYPKSRYAHLAQYWMAETSYAQRDFKQAIKEYERLVDDYPTSPNVGKAMLKIGYSYHELGDDAAVKKVLNKLIARDPGSMEAGQAHNLLLRLKPEDND